MSRLKEIMQKKEARKNLLLTSMDRMVSQLKALGALKIILFGSVAEDDVDTHSDLDLLVIMPSHKTGKEWTHLIYETIERKTAADLIVYNEQEFKEKRSTSRFLQDITKGKVVYEKAVSRGSLEVADPGQR